MDGFPPAPRSIRTRLEFDKTLCVNRLRDQSSAPRCETEFESFFISQVHWDQNGGLGLTPQPFWNNGRRFFRTSCKSFVLSIKAFALAVCICVAAREIPENQSAET